MITQEIPAEKVVSKSAFARAVGLSPGRVTQLVTQGLPTRKDGRIDLEAASAWYRANITRPAVKTESSTAASRATPTDSSRTAAQTFLEAKSQREWVRLRKDQFEMSLREKKLISVEEVRAATTTRASAEREALLNWPARISADLAARFGISESELTIVLDVELRKFLEERSQHGIQTSRKIQKEETKRVRKKR